MAPTPTHQTRIVAGKMHVSCIATSVDLDVSNAMHNRTALCDTAYRFIKGRPSHSMQVAAMFDDDTSAGSYWSELTANHTDGALLPVTVAPAGLAAGNYAWLAEAYQMSLAPSGDVDGAVDMAIDFAVTGRAMFGQSVADLDEVSTSTNTAAVDGGAATTNGGVAHLHVTAVDAPTTLDVTVEHSVDGATSWDTLATFTQVATATASERVTVAAGTTVRRYLRASITVDGTSYTCAVAFARG